MVSSSFQSYSSCLGFFDLFFTRWPVMKRNLYTRVDVCFEFFVLFIDLHFSNKSIYSVPLVDERSFSIVKHL